MSRLAARPDYNATIAARFAQRCNETHEVEWRARVARGEEVLVDELPIMGGTLTLDSSDPIRRRLTLEVGGEEWAPRDVNDPLVPFGNGSSCTSGSTKPTGPTGSRG